LSALAGADHDTVTCWPSLTVTVAPLTGFKVGALGTPALLEEHIPPQQLSSPQYGELQQGVHVGGADGGTDAGGSPPQTFPLVPPLVQLALPQQS
jgi:hypothetical protein